MVNGTMFITIFKKFRICRIFVRKAKKILNLGRFSPKNLMGNTERNRKSRCSKIITARIVGKVAGVKAAGAGGGIVVVVAIVFKVWPLLALL